MQLPLYQVDAFTDRAFAGNPAAVVPLTRWLPDEQLQAIAAENNLSETAFLVRARDSSAAPAPWQLRWFTPSAEVELCGHATLASAFVVHRDLDPGIATMAFDTKSGRLWVHAAGEELRMDFPSRPPALGATPPGLAQTLGRPIVHYGEAPYSLAVLGSQREVAELRPNMAALGQLEKPLIVSAAADEGRGLDFVSRFFAPTLGVPEDPVTGSAHCTLAPYWAERLGRNTLHAAQISQRGGTLTCRMDGDRVHLTGTGVLVLQGTLFL